jgi:hypothetical protein
VSGAHNVRVVSGPWEKEEGSGKVTGEIGQELVGVWAVWGQKGNQEEVQ